MGRFIIFGCRPNDELLVEIHTDDFRAACMYALRNTVAGYRARIYDNERKRFVKQRVIDRAVAFYGW